MVVAFIFTILYSITESPGFFAEMCFLIEWIEVALVNKIR